MARLKNLLSLLFIVVVILCALIFYFRNDTAVPVDLFIIELDGLGVGGWILASFIVGTTVGVLLSWPLEWFWKASRKSKDKSLQKANTELARIKNTAKGS